MSGTGECPSLKRDAPVTDGSVEQEAKKARVDTSVPAAAGPVDLAQVKRQVEYYFSDENLKYDKFFNPIIKASPEGWLPMSNILSCKRIRNLRATEKDIVEALKGSPLEVESLDGGVMAVRRTSPVPALEERPARVVRENKNGNKKQRRVDDFHAAGCIIKLEDIPCEVSWEAVKVKLTERVPDKPARPLTAEEEAAGKKPFIERSIQFVSTPSPAGRCFALMAAFTGDRELFASFEPLEINGANVKVSLVSDADEASEFLKIVPALIKKRRERDIVRKRKELNARPIILGTHEFASIDHLRKCLKEVLAEFQPGKIVNQKTSKVLRGLLEFHPTGASKLKDVVDFKVDLVTHAGDKAGTTAQSRCFFVVRADGTTEDFSLQKCFAGLCQNPPFKEATKDNAAAPKDADMQQAAGASTETAATPAATETETPVVAETETPAVATSEA